MSGVPFIINQTPPLHSNVDIILPNKWINAGEEDTFFTQTESNPVNRQIPFAVSMTEITTEGNGDNPVYEIPEISASFRTKLSISQDIQEMVSDDIYFEYTIYNILNLLDRRLNSVADVSHVNVNLEADKDDSEWKHADIIIKLKRESSENIRSLWKEIGSEISNFYNSLKGSLSFSEIKINELHNFIYILVDKEE